MDYNKVILKGRLTRDVEFRATAGGTSVARLGLAVNRKYKKGDGQVVEEVTFVDVDLFGRWADIANESLSKGAPVLVEGRLKLDQWDDKNTGQKRTALRVAGDMALPLAPKPGSEAGERRPASTGAPPSRPTQSAGAPATQSADDDVPF